MSEGGVEAAAVGCGGALGRRAGGWYDEEWFVSGGARSSLIFQYDGTVSLGIVNLLSGGVGGRRADRH